MKDALSMITLALAALFALAWLSWRASKVGTSQKETDQARKITELTQKADMAAFNSCNTDDALEETLKHGTF